MEKILSTIGDEAGIVGILMSAPEDRTPRVIWPLGSSWNVGGPMTKWSGSFSIRLPSQREHEIVFRALDGLSISIGGDHTVVRVTNDFGAEFAHPMREIEAAATGSSGS